MSQFALTSAERAALTHYRRGAYQSGNRAFEELTANWSETIPKCPVPRPAAIPRALHQAGSDRNRGEPSSCAPIVLVSYFACYVRTYGTSHTCSV